MGLLVDREHDRVLGRVDVQADEVRELGRELGIGRAHSAPLAVPPCRCLGPTFGPRSTLTVRDSHLSENDEGGDQARLPHLDPMFAALPAGEHRV